MTEKNKQKGTSSSLSSPIFGSKIYHSSVGIYASIVSTQSPKILSRESVRFQASSNKTKNETVNSKVNTQGIDGIFKDSDGGSHDTKNTGMSWLYHNQKVHPCNQPSSSIYYGGQDIYPQPQSTQNATFNSSNNNNGGEDDSELATRGDWWQGGLYY